ncbi:RDD family protein [Mycobacterium spongiae]|uniref:RDD family protein n=1 Tax=Mycobacterium spongiae TaxID=886343 RepID=A0A975K231_9MYCO|nr:RDD family protein [Mycobacterium spongiae]QUR69259.1 RDD family protein [Mycobacterium spongiae]
MSEVVTGDAVVLDVQIAQLPVRAVSAVIDIIVILIAYMLGLMLWAATLTEFDEAWTTAFLIIFTVLAMVGYPLAFETATRGRSVGKIVMGLRVVSDDGGPERFRQALFRALTSVVEIWMLLGSPAVICSMFSPKAKRVGDIFAGTVVVSERGPRLGPPPAMPPSLAWWASSLQLSGLTPGQAEVARQFLSRATQLDHQLRDQMAYRIANDVLSHIAPPPPPGVPPQLVLAAVLAERHRRELARLLPTMPQPGQAVGPAPWPAPGPGAPPGPVPWPSPHPHPHPQGWWPGPWPPSQPAIPWPEPDSPAAQQAPRRQQRPDAGGFAPPR